ncbi:MAG: hypothetical protein WA885_09240 [Phormidesmis sp.]
MDSDTTLSTKNISNKDLFQYWYDRVEFKNLELLETPGHIETFRLRHDCTNYDELWKSSPVKALPGLERDRTIAIIKYECTARVLQKRATVLRNQVADVEAGYREMSQEYSKLRQILRALQTALFGKDQEIKQLQKQVLVLTAEAEAVRAESEKSKAYAELLEEFEKLQKEHAQVRKNLTKVSKRRQELAHNNMSLGGRLAHTKRYIKERDEAREILAEQKEQIAELASYSQQQQQKIVELTKRNEALQASNRRLTDKLSKLGVS